MSSVNLVALLFCSVIPELLLTANVRTKILDFRGFESSRILILRGGILMSIGNSPESLSQRILVGRFLVRRLGVEVSGPPPRKSPSELVAPSARPRRTGGGPCPKQVGKVKNPTCYQRLMNKHQGGEGRGRRSRWVGWAFSLLDWRVSSLRRGHASLLCIVPTLTDDPRRESNSTADTCFRCHREASVPWNKYIYIYIYIYTYVYIYIYTHM